MSNPIPIFYGKIIKGRGFNPDKQELYLHYLESLTDQEVQVTVQKKRKLRTIPQNNYAYGVVLKQLSDYTGHTVTELKEIAKKDLGFVRYLRLKNGKVHEITRSSATFDTKEWEEYMRRLRQMGDEFGIFIEEPK